MQLVLKLFFQFKLRIFVLKHPSVLKKLPIQYNVYNLPAPVCLRFFRAISQYANVIGYVQTLVDTHWDSFTRFN